MSSNYDNQAVREAIHELNRRHPQPVNLFKQSQVDKVERMCDFELIVTWNKSKDLATIIKKEVR